MKFVLEKFFSIGVGIVLLLLFALSCAFATFVENDFGTASAYALVYGAWWFGLVQVWLVIIVANNIYKYKLFRKDKFPTMLFHFSFLFILLGSILTRYYGFEGSINIREGEKENLVTSLSSFVQIKAKKGDKRYSKDIEKMFSVANGSSIYSLLNTNAFTINIEVDGKDAVFKYKDIIINPEQKIVDDKKSKGLISLMLSAKNLKAKELVIKDGEDLTNHTISIGYNRKKEKPKNANLLFDVVSEGDKFYFISNKPVSWYKMSNGAKGEYKAGKKVEFLPKQLYTVDGINIVPKHLSTHGRLAWVSGEKSPIWSKALLGELSYNGERKEIALMGLGRGYRGIKKGVRVGGAEFSLQWGSKMYELPFDIELIDFQLQRYPGSMSPSSYASEVKVLDKKDGLNMPYRIFMNHVLDYKGFRFFQSSYDKDEKGTILSVNRDPGKFPTYLGYAMLFLGLFLNILNPQSRFRKLSSSINKGVTSKALVLFLLIGINQNLFANDVKVYNKKHSDYFATILSQNHDGRIRPVDTVASEVLFKVYGKHSFEGNSANQVFLGMLTKPMEWQKVPIIKVHDPKLKKILGLKKAQKYARFDDFFEEKGDRRYKLISYAEDANRKKPAARNLFDKDIIKVDERLNVCYLVYTGEILKIFPKIHDKSKLWLSPAQSFMYLSKEQSQNISNMLDEYFKALNKNDYKGANLAVDKIKSYQKQYANDIIPSNTKIKTEILFNNLQIFLILFPAYVLFGLILLFAIFLKMLMPKINIDIVKGVMFFLILSLFIIHTAGLGMRWYISGHAPWSNGYESMVYIAWALGLSGIIFYSKSVVSLSLTSILAGISLLVAHMSWADPQITNMVPVLKSYWLTIHVSIITASYGFLGLCAMLGFFTLILFILVNPKKDDERNRHIKQSISEATKINEMAMILGLTMLTVGNFLGGIWANESWGRYWGWDAKETWALVSILIYSAIVHLRFVPKLNNQYVFALASTFGYWSIVMTYFGVNFYLSGMHSYAAGDPVPIPIYVTYIALAMIIVASLAFINKKVATRL